MCAHIHVNLQRSMLEPEAREVAIAVVGVRRKGTLSGDSVIRKFTCLAAHGSGRGFWSRPKRVLSVELLLSFQVYHRLMTMVVFVCSLVVESFSVNGKFIQRRKDEWGRSSRLKSII